MIKPIPEGWHTVTPRLFVEEPERLVAFLKDAFGAVEGPRVREDAPAELRIGDSMVMVGNAQVRRETSSFFYLYVRDADATYRKALEAGAASLEEPELTLYGDRRATVEDPFGNVWQIATHVKDHERP
ncbi:MAG TPA: VOC family protein [Candidatus Dormibacteraeota bacterium]|nr:VOC family protein [Candidatus Dormibacteraeota bacterium]